MKLSILISVYNESDFIEECLDSIFKCDNVQYEVVVVDDFSIDDTFVKLEEYQVSKGYENLIVCRNDRKGKNNAFNMAYSRSSGDFFCFVGGDDKVVPETIKGRVELVAEVSGPAISLCKLKTFSDNPKLDGIIYPRNARGGALAGGAMLFNRQFANVVFPLPTLLPNEDTWLKLAIKHCDVSVLHYPFVSYLYRQHSNNSVKLNSVYSEFSDIISRRNAALGLFRNKFFAVLDEESIKKLDGDIAIEAHRSSGSVLSILTVKNVSLRDKASAVLMSHPYLYRLRVVFYRLIAGM